MVIIIQSGFQAVKLEIFRKESLSKGIGLVNSCHVSNVIAFAAALFCNCSVKLFSRKVVQKF